METSRRGFLRGLAKAPLAVPALSMIKLPEAKAEPKPIHKRATETYTTMVSVVGDFTTCTSVPGSFASETFDID